MILATKQFFERLIKGIGDTTAMCFNEGVKADKEVKRDLEAVRDTLWDIRTTLREIRKLLEWAAQNPNDTLDKWGAAVIADDLKPKAETKPAPEDQFTDKKPEKAADKRYMSLNTLYRKLKDKYTFSQLKNLCIDLGVFMGYKKSGGAGNWFLKRGDAEKLLKELRA